MSTPTDRLLDFEHLKRDLGFSDEPKARAGITRFKAAACATFEAGALARHETSMRKLRGSSIARIVESPALTLVIMVAISINSVWTFAESNTKDTSGVGYLVVEIAFTSLFTLEALLKIIHHKMEYFYRMWNLFDLALVVAGLSGIIIRALGDDDISRALQVFLIMRSLRQIRLIRLVQVIREQMRPQDEVSQRSAESILRFNILVGYVRAHVECQKHLVDIFGSGGEADVVEICLCVLQSQVQVYKAMSCGPEIVDNLDGDWRLKETQLCEKSLKGVSDLLKFICSARDLGVLRGKEAEEIIETMQHHTKKFQSRIRTIFEGRVVEPRYSIASTDPGVESVPLEPPAGGAPCEGEGERGNIAAGGGADLGVLWEDHGAATSRKCSTGAGSSRGPGSCGGSGSGGGAELGTESVSTAIPRSADETAQAQEVPPKLTPASTMDGTGRPNASIPASAGAQGVAQEASPEARTNGAEASAVCRLGSHESDDVRSPRKRSKVLG